MRFVVEVITVGGGLPDFLGASFSSRVLSVSEDSVSMSLVLRGAKKLRVITVLVGSLPAADFGADVIDFLSVCEVSLEIYRVNVFLLPENRHHGLLIPMWFWSLLHIVLPAHSPSKWPTIHSMLVCICHRQR
jgi:hypothetical protein